MSKERKIKRTKRLYKKHTPNKRAINAVLFIVLIAILVGLGYIVSQEWAKRFGPNAPQSSIQIVSSSPSSASSDGTDTSEGTSSSDTTSSAEQAPNRLEGMNAVHMSAETIMRNSADGFASYLKQAKADGYNAVYVELKKEDGTILFNTSNVMAQAYGAVSENPIELGDIVSAIKSEGLTPIAQLSTLKDARAAHVSNENSYAYSTRLETNWLDNSASKGGKPWLNPYMENARKYIVDLSTEIIDAGFDKIVLENVTFPEYNTGKMNVISKTMSYSEILRQMIDEVADAVGKENVYVGYHGEQLVKTLENPYYVGAGEIGYENIAVLINEYDLERVMLNIYSETPLTSDKQLEGAKRLLDAAEIIAADNGSVITYIQSDTLESRISETVESYGFKNSIT